MHRVAHALKGLLVVSLVIALGVARCGWAHAAQNDSQSSQSDQGDSQSSAPEAGQDQGNQSAGQDSGSSDTDTDQDDDSDNQNESSDSSDQGNQ
ncbi:MAG TPA: hypothetical protein VMH37_07995 [Candidatus Binataceae bacterium]|nr:hypothetical protein [Candidatus Binataceae bacterium]